MPRALSVKKIEQEIEASIANTKAKRRQRDSIERPTPDRMFGRADHALSEAQNHLGSLITTEERATSPDVYKLADSLFDAIDKIRWRIRDKR